MHTIFNLQTEEPVLRLKAPFNNHFFDRQEECFGIKGNPYNHFFMISSTDLCTFYNKGTCKVFLFRIRSQNYVYLIIGLTQEEEHIPLNFANLVQIFQ